MMTKDSLRTLWRNLGGSFHGPRVEHGTMPEAPLLAMLERVCEIERHHALLVNAVSEFVIRVEAGEIKSTRTYSTFKKLLDDLPNSADLKEPCVHDWCSPPNLAPYCCKCGETLDRESTGLSGRPRINVDLCECITGPGGCGIGKCARGPVS